ASTIAPMVDWIYDVITWISIFFFVLIVVLMGYIMYRYRRKEHAADTGGPTHHTPLEVTWSVIPLILVITIFYIGMKGFITMQQVPTGAYEVYVTAQKWSWTFQHRNGATDAVLDVPAGRPVKLIMNSTDVLHALYIPAFRVKMDVVPGRYRTTWFEVPDNGERREFDLFCAEYCGTQHSTMITRVHVIPADEWDDYIEQKANLVKDLSDEQLPCYAAQRLYPRCSSCHSLDGSNLTGPTFKGLWERTEAGETVFTTGESLAGLVGPGKAYDSAEDYLRQSILNPQKHIRENYTGAMPSFQGQLKEREIQALVMFLKDPYAVVDEKGKLLQDCDF
ncbi:MAG: cytochrome c oxidase subunit II, partial [Planctomycetota bacterium]